MPRLTIKSKEKLLGDHQIQKGVSLTIGRRKKNNLTINDMAVSGYHAKIDSVGDGYVLIDLQSKNGTFVNDQFINSHWLIHGDKINIGEYSLVFDYSEMENTLSDDTDDVLDTTVILDTVQYRNRIRKNNPTRSITNVAGFWDTSRIRKQDNEITPGLPMGPTNIRKEAQGTLNYLAGGNGDFDLTRKYTTIGKHPASDIVVKGFFMGQTAISISKLSDGFKLCYVGGISKPKVNQKTIRESIMLKNEDIISIASTKLQFTNGKPQKASADDRINRTVKPIEQEFRNGVPDAG